MIRYLVCGTYTDGKTAGKSFMIRKGGYLVDRFYKPFPDECYSSRQAAQAVASRLNRRNEEDTRIDKQITPCRYTVSEINY